MVLRRDVPFAQVVAPDHRELDRGATIREFRIVRREGTRVVEREIERSGFEIGQLRSQHGHYRLPHLLGEPECASGVILRQLREVAGISILDSVRIQGSRAAQVAGQDWFSGGHQI